MAQSGGVAALVGSKLNDSRPGKAADTRKKFVIFMDPSIKANLDTLAIVTRTGKIELASELFAIAIGDAITACQNAGKVDAKGNTVGEDSTPAKGKKSEEPPVPK